MNYDPNWFYSSIAQCAAALVGLLGAVLATRLQQQLNEVRATFAEVAEMLRGLRDTLSLRSRAVEDFRPFAKRRILEIEAALARGETQLEVAQEANFWGGGRSGSPWVIQVETAVLAKYDDLYHLADSTISELGSHLSLATVGDARAADASLARLQNLLPPDVVQGLIPGLRASILAIEAANTTHLRRASIRVTAIFAAILGWLCVFGLIAPLAFLSAYAGISKTSLLVVFSIGVMAIPAYIAFELFRIVKMKNVSISST